MMSNFSASSADRGLAILELLVDEPQGLSMSAIAQRLELPVSATHRLLTVMVARRYVQQNARSEHYQATMLIAALGLRLLETSNLPDVCQPLLDELALETGELVRLSVLENKHLIWVAKAQGSRDSIRYDPISGREVTLHATAMGKAWLATMPEDEAVAIIAERGFGGDPVGPNAVKTIDQFKEQLRLTRDRGFALVEGEAEAGISAIATVVRDASVPERPVVATISIGGPSFRLERDRLVSFAPAMFSTSDRLSGLWPVRTYREHDLQRSSAA